MFRRTIAGLAILVVLSTLATIAWVYHYDDRRVSRVKGGEIEKILIARGCDYCHTPGARLPFYASLPIAKQLTERDILTGMRFFDLRPVLQAIRQDKPVPEADLAKIEAVVASGEMPPALYKMMHWSGHISDDDRLKLESWIVGQRTQFYTPPGTPASLRGSALLPLPDELPVDPRKAALGKRLFHDLRLSADNSESCATCHDLQNGGMDGRTTAWGVRGQRGPINVPTVLNAAFNRTQFWDGRAKDLAEQAGGPVQNPVEMGSSWPQVMAKLNGDDALKATFSALYPQGLSPYALTDAIAQFEMQLITPHGPFDRYLNGDNEALTAQQKRGLTLFRQNKCGTCHTGVNLGGQSFERMGRWADYFADRGGLTHADNGRFNVTHDEQDRYRFKTPTLRNVSLTGPWLHDGSATRLSDAVRVMLKYQVGVSLTDDQVDDLVALLQSTSGPLAPTAASEGQPEPVIPEKR
ncbi:cytochrome c peroxidase [Erwinia sp. SLM-02]|uniref:cytochrome c peroxidase n=1 Tax=Erwinia sp. SLM-02 TaxID=3020057 RepID=UPI003080D0EA